MNSKKLLQLFVLPFVFYIIPIVDIKFIPEIKDEYIYFSICGILFIVYVLILFKNWKLFVTAKKNFLTIIILIAFLFIHVSLLLIIELIHNRDNFSKEVIQTKSNLFEPTIYILKTVGFINSYEGAEIGYSKRWSPFYTTYYHTKNHLEFVQEDSTQIVIREYRYERSAVDKKIFIRKDELIKREINVFRINRSKLD